MKLFYKLYIHNDDANVPAALVCDRVTVHKIGKDAYAARNNDGKLVAALSWCFVEILEDSISLSGTEVGDDDCHDRTWVLVPVPQEAST